MERTSWGKRGAGGIAIVKIQYGGRHFFRLGLVLFISWTVGKESSSSQEKNHRLIGAGREVGKKKEKNRGWLALSREHRRRAEGEQALIEAARKGY